MPGMKRALELIKTVQSGEPVLNLNRSVAAETLWPAALGKEADKAASILRSFFVDGFIVPYRTLGTCPQQVITDCHSLAIFHVLRAGLRSPQASGSGVMISRLPDGKWSSASAIVVHYELPEGVDVADMVVLVNSEDGFNPRLNPGGLLELGLNIAPGPIPQSDAPAASLRTMPRQKDLGFFYAKSKGELLEVDLRYLVIREATAENERSYGVPGVSARKILSGQVSIPSGTPDQLYSTLKALDQRSLSLSGLPKPGKCPGDRRIKAPVTRGETDRDLSDDWRGAGDDDSSDEDIKVSSKYRYSIGG